MKKTTIITILFLILGLGVFLSSYYITSWTNNTKIVIESLQRNLEQSHREKMRSVLKIAKEGINYRVETNYFDIDDEEIIQDLIYEFVAPIKTNSFGNILLIRISPDEKILYDSSTETIKPHGTLERYISDEIITQTLALDIIEKFILENSKNDVTLENIINKQNVTADDLIYIKENYSELYIELDEYIVYEDILQVEKILREIRLENSTDFDDNHYWKIKGGQEELLEWIIIPSSSFGFKDEPGNIGGIYNPNEKWVLMIRTPKEKIYRNFKEIKKNFTNKIAIAKILYVIFAIMMSIIMIVLTFLKEVIAKK